SKRATHRDGWPAVTTASSSVRLPPLLAPAALSRTNPGRCTPVAARTAASPSAPASFRPGFARAPKPLPASDLPPPVPPVPAGSPATGQSRRLADGSGLAPPAPLTSPAGIRYPSAPRTTRPTSSRPFLLLCPFPHSHLFHHMNTPRRRLLRLPVAD